MVVKRHKITVQGIVQGVGFRPHVYRLAREFGLSGFVRNNNAAVIIEVQGGTSLLFRFRERLLKEAPVLSQIVQVNAEEISINGDGGFVILESERDSANETFISPDTAVCPDCIRELFDPQNRRYRYPFINCTNCGPRYTIIRQIPYDRPNTSMLPFPMCPECEAEYLDPANRRFHAQPNACSICGPSLALYYNQGHPIAASDPVSAVIRFLLKGKIIAIRGIGGFHLAADAANDEAVQTLRQRKGRAQKPFALMAASLETIRKHCHVSETEKKLLTHYSTPIVLLKSRHRQGIAPAVAPGQRFLGFMLPYTPLHHLLFKETFDTLVMTSANFSEEPIVCSNEEAFRRLAPLADYILIHNREILQRSDDSVARVLNGKPQILRRSRGFVPLPVFLSHPVKQPLLACGGELKNTIALAKGNKVFLSQHIGDLDNPAALSFFEETIDHLQNILEIKPAAVVHDLHPEYLSTKWALQQPGLPKIAVQHHHAHLAAVMAENQMTSPVIGIILDGSGYGPDGTIWGGEILTGNFASFKKIAGLQPVPLPGGTAAIKQPWRMALAYLKTAYRNESIPDLPFLQNIPENDIGVILQMIDRKINTPLTSSCGRLFDGVSALLHIRSVISYEAQAAVELEMAADDSAAGIFEGVLQEADYSPEIPVSGLVRAVVRAMRTGEAVSVTAAKFHRTLAELFIEKTKNARVQSGLNTAALSGGVFQNRLFSNYMMKRLQEEGFRVLTHSAIPPNDGGLALGQIMIADAVLRQNVN
ncbi:MAG: carbamoyltransferase HypF [Calditrichia bacterium]